MDEKRTEWTTVESIRLLRAAIKRHDRFLMKIEEFWEEVGAVVGHSGKELAKFVLSLGTDYRKILINLRTSGTESRDEPMLRDSAELFVAFDEYYQLFHSQGGSIQPESSLAQPQSRSDNAFQSSALIARSNDDSSSPTAASSQPQYVDYVPSPTVSISAVSIRRRSVDSLQPSGKSVLTASILPLSYYLLSSTAAQKVAAIKRKLRQKKGMTAQKSVTVTYMLWLFLGWFGVHHFYLGRDRQAFVWFWTLGGCCGAGWLLEFFHLRSYVELANGCRDEVSHQVSQGQQPKFALKRFAGELTFSMFLGLLSTFAFPEDTEIDWRIIALLACFCSAVGVHTVANIGNEECAFSASLLGAFIPLPFYLLTSNNSLTSIVTYSAIVSSVCSNWRGKQWKPFHMQTADSNRHMCCRLFIISIASTLIISAMMSGVYFNGRVLTQDGQEVRIKDAINHVFSSPAWTNKQQTAWQLYNSLTTEGFDSFWRALNIALDPEGEERTYRLLNVTSSATQKEITEQYRKLMKLHHPDKVRTNTELERRRAEQYFMEIQQAFDRLSRIRQRRTKNSRRVEL